MILHILSIKRGNRCCCRCHCCCLRSDSISAGWTHNSGTVFSFEQQSMPQTKQQAACCDLTKTDGPSSVELAETPLSPARLGLVWPAGWLVACQSHQINNRERPAACTKIKEWQLKIAKASNADGCATSSPSITQQERAKSRRGKRR